MPKRFFNILNIFKPVSKKINTPIPNHATSKDGRGKFLSTIHNDNGGSMSKLLYKILRNACD
jgi:hypothetical protein